METEPLLHLVRLAQTNLDRVLCEQDFESEGHRLAAVLALTELAERLEAAKPAAAGTFWDRKSLKIQPADTMDRWLDRLDRALRKCPTPDHLRRLLSDNAAMIDAARLLPRWSREFDPLLRITRRELGMPEPEMSY